MRKLKNKVSLKDHVKLMRSDEQGINLLYFCCMVRFAKGLMDDNYQRLLDDCFIVLESEKKHTANLNKCINDLKLCVDNILRVHITEYGINLEPAINRIIDQVHEARVERVVKKLKGVNDSADRLNASDIGAEENILGFVQNMADAMDGIIETLKTVKEEFEKDGSYCKQHRLLSEDNLTAICRHATHAHAHLNLYIDVVDGLLFNKDFLTEEQKNNISVKTALKVREEKIDIDMDVDIGGLV